MTLRLSAGHETLIDDTDVEWAAFRWGANNTGSAIYARHHALGYLHRVILGAKKGQIVDHINGDTLDNRRSNLRLVTAQENMMNRVGNSRRKTGTFKGVVKSPAGNWISQTKNNGVPIHIGTFSDEAHAAIAYDVRAIEMWGDMALTNFPRSLLAIVDVNKLMQIKTHPRRKF